MTKIISLEVSNVKRLKAVRIEPDGNLVVIGGDNAQGKTSVLDSIMYVLGGKGGIPQEALRRGAEKGTIVADLGDLTVTRTIKPGGSTTLVVENKDGARYQSPQTMLDAMTGKISFDPLAFKLMSPAAQLIALRDLVGIDTTELEERRKTIYDRRTEANRRIRILEAEYGALKYDEAAGIERVEVAGLVAKRNEMVAQSDRRRAQENEVSASDKRAVTLQTELDKLRGKVEEVKDQLRVATQAYVDADYAFGEMVEPDFELIDRTMADADDTNRKVVENVFRLNKAKDLDKARDEALEMTAGISNIDNEREAMVAEAEFPVQGLGFNEYGVTLDGIEFSQCSGAEQLHCSVAMGLAANPELKVLLVRDGSLLDERSLAMVQRMAEDADAQVWIERVGHGEEVQIVMEDGEVKSDG